MNIFLFKQILFPIMMHAMNSIKCPHSVPDARFERDLSVILPPDALFFSFLLLLLYLEFSDYEPVSVTLSFGGGITNQCFNVIILDDFIIENEENFSLILEPAFQDEITLVGILNVSVIIIDDDGTYNIIHNI